MSPFPDWLSGRRGSHTPYHPTPPSSSLAHGSRPHFASLASPSAISRRKLLRGSCNKVRPTQFFSLFYSQLCLSINLNLGMTSKHSTNPSNCRQDVYTAHGDGYLRELSRMLPTMGMEKKKLWEGISGLGKLLLLVLLFLLHLLNELVESRIKCASRMQIVQEIL